MNKRAVEIGVDGGKRGECAAGAAAGVETKRNETTRGGGIFFGVGNGDAKQGLIHLNGEEEMFTPLPQSATTFTHDSGCSEEISTAPERTTTQFPVSTHV